MKRVHLVRFVLSCTVMLQAGFLRSAAHAGEIGPETFALLAVPSTMEAEVTVGSTYTVAVHLSSEEPGLEAWSFGLCVDAGDQRIVTAVAGADLDRIRFGQPPEYMTIEIEDGDGGTQAGVSQAVVLDLQGGVAIDAIPRDQAASVLEVELEPSATTVNQTVVATFCDEVGEPPVETTMVVGNMGYAPATQEAAVVTVVRDPPALISFARDGYTLPVAGGTVKAAVRVRSRSALYGFSFGVAHDSAVAVLQGVELSLDLVADLDGNEPEFWVVDGDPVGGSGFTVGVVFQLNAGGGSDLRSITSDDENPSTEVFDATYATAPGAAADATTTLAITDELGAPPVAILFDIGQELFPESRDAQLRVVEGAGERAFVRGDVNADGMFNIADPVRLLEVLFLRVPLGYDCEEAMDINDDGTVNVADPVYLLSYQFVSGPAPPPPFPGCDPGTPGPTYLGCTEYPACGN